MLDGRGIDGECLLGKLDLDTDGVKDDVGGGWAEGARLLGPGGRGKLVGGVEILEQAQMGIPEGEIPLTEDVKSEIFKSAREV
jgi:hypothetical protein